MQPTIMTTKIAIVAALLTGLATVHLPADAHTAVNNQLPDMLRYLPSELQRELLETNKLFIFGEASEDRTLAPPFSIPAVATFDDGMQAEILQYIPAPSAESFDSDDYGLHLKLYNLLLSIHTMKGIKYYSASRDRMRTLFTESHFVSDPDNRNRLTPPTATTVIPEETVYYLLQDDATFGENMYRVRYIYNGETLQITMINTHSLRYRFIPAIWKGNLHITLLVHPLNEGLLLYGHIHAKPTMSFGLQSRIRDSLGNRLEAVNTWFFDRAYPLITASSR